ncbi:putative pre-mRNA-splicing factor ATP-dependent RNA helicase dhx15 [Dictyocoela muelleri]|nr:putative pre-mRNA-splicing factor ATP-dependent RNA helicase dhx15 [Dictyocoela muelleri]
MLPIETHKIEILKKLKSPKPLLISAPTGSGKSTYIPTLITENYPTKSILIVEPRRIAVTSLYNYLKNKIDIGYKIRFREENFKSNVLIVTDGMALNLLGHCDKSNKKLNNKVNVNELNDNELNDNKLNYNKLNDNKLNNKNITPYDIIILDEIHERNVRLDILMGILKNKKNIKLILMSATPDCKRIFENFNCDILDIKVKGYPLSIFYEEEAVSDYIHECFMKIRMIVNGENELKNYKIDNENYKIDNENYKIINDNKIDNDKKFNNDKKSIDKKSINKNKSNNKNSILVFLPGEEDIHELSQLLKKLPQTEVFKIYSSLSDKKQELIFRDSKYVKIILSTNICESSLTIPNINYVIDTGLHNIKIFRKLNYFGIRGISVQSAIQRAGRANRSGPGVCYDYILKICLNVWN